VNLATGNDQIDNIMFTDVKFLLYLLIYCTVGCIALDGNHAQTDREQEECLSYISCDSCVSTVTSTCMWCVRPEGSQCVSKHHLPQEENCTAVIPPQAESQCSVVGISKGVFTGLILIAVFAVLDACVIGVVILKMTSQVDRWTELQTKKFQESGAANTKQIVVDELLEIVRSELSSTDKQELVWIGTPANTSFRLGIARLIIMLPLISLVLSLLVLMANDVAGIIVSVFLAILTPFVGVFCSKLVLKGKVYVLTQSEAIVIYKGLLPKSIAWRYSLKSDNKIVVFADEEEDIGDIRADTLYFSNVVKVEGVALLMRLLQSRINNEKR